MACISDKGVRMAKKFGKKLSGLTHAQNYQKWPKCESVLWCGLQFIAKTPFSLLAPSVVSFPVQ